jgi:hypothetical protein
MKPSYLLLTVVALTEQCDANSICGRQKIGLKTDSLIYALAQTISTAPFSCSTSRTQCTQRGFSDHNKPVYVAQQLITSIKHLFFHSSAMQSKLKEKWHSVMKNTVGTLLYRAGTVYSEVLILKEKGMRKHHQDSWTILVPTNRTSALHLPNVSSSALQAGDSQLLSSLSDS